MQNFTRKSHRSHGRLRHRLLIVLQRAIKVDRPYSQKSGAKTRYTEVGGLSRNAVRMHSESRNPTTLFPHSLNSFQVSSIRRGFRDCIIPDSGFCHAVYLASGATANQTCLFRRICGRVAYDLTLDCKPSWIRFPGNFRVSSQYTDSVQSFRSEEHVRSCVKFVTLSLHRDLSAMFTVLNAMCCCEGFIGR